MTETTADPETSEDQNLPLIGPAVGVLATLRAFISKSPASPMPLAVLLHGDPGVAKSHLLDALALELTGNCPHAIEQVNGQSLSVDLVRQWRERQAYGNLFSKWTVKRIDEFDCASPAARNEMLTLLDYLRPHHAILATTNDYTAVRATGNRRLESRFKCLRVAAPTAREATDYLVKHFKPLPRHVAVQIAAESVPDGCLGALSGVNMRQCIESAQCWLARTGSGERALAA